MTESDLLEWYKENKVQLVNSVLDTLRNGSDFPTIVMMAGYPGSGKTEYIKNSNELSALPVIDLDDLVKLFPDYRPENYYVYRKPAGRLLAAVFEEALNRSLSFILEGTFSSEISLQNIDRALKRGYFVQIIRIMTSKEKSWEYAQTRRIITGRPTSKDGFEETVPKVDKYFNEAKEIYIAEPKVNIKEIEND